MGLKFSKAPLDLKLSLTGVLGVIKRHGADNLEALLNR